MKNRKKSLLLAAIASLCILCGCGEKKDDEKLIIIDGEKYVKSGEEYTKIDLSPKVFEPGTHRIIYTEAFKPGIKENATGWDRFILSIPESPEGYRFVDFTYDEDWGMYLYLYENEVRVEVSGIYLEDRNIISFNHPGEVVKDLTLGN